MKEEKEEGKRKKGKRCGGVVWFDRKESEERHGNWEWSTT